MSPLRHSLRWYELHGAVVAACFCLVATASAQTRTLDQSRIEQLTGLKGTLVESEGVFRVASPRTDVKVTVSGTPLSPFAGLTTWVAFKPGVKAEAMIMGDLVLLQDEANPVIDAALAAGLSVTALHNHFFYDDPKVFFMHVDGEGSTEALATGVRKVLDAVAAARKANPEPPHAFAGPPVSAASRITPEPLAALLGQRGDVKDGMAKFTFGRQTQAACGCKLGAAMGVNTWAAFVGTDDHALVDGDFACLPGELQPTLKALRAAGINIVAIHNHMEDESPRIIFLHYWGIGRADALAKGVKAALDAQKPPARADDPAPPTLLRTIKLDGVGGRIDHMAADAAGTRLWIAALGNNSIEVVNLQTGTRERTLADIGEPQGVCSLPKSNRMAVASGSDGMCRVFNEALKRVASVGSLDDADNVRYDPGANRLYVGYGHGALAVIDPDKGVKLADIRLSGHPESFQLERNGPRIFVNVPTARQVAVVDRDKGAVIATWPVTAARSNFPMALDEGHRRLFIACREPARLLVLDTDTGKSVAELDCCGDADDVFYDAARQRLYVSGGAGCINVFAQTDPDHYQSVATIKTVAGARTSLFVPQTGRLYLAVPSGLLRATEIREYDVAPQAAGRS
jgi:hypothetical protein